MSTTGMTRTTSTGSRPRRHGRRNDAAALALIAVIGLSLSGCFSSGFVYVSHRSPDATILGFKLPSKWKTFDTQQVLEATNGPIGSAEALEAWKSRDKVGSATLTM